MTLSDVELKTIKDYFTNKPVHKAFLFGSYSRNEATPKSDVDILVELDYSEHIGMSFVSMKFELEEKLQKRIDLVPSGAVSKYVLPFIDKDKRLIYEK